MIIDSHCHLEDELISRDILNKINDDSEIEACITLGGNLKTSKEAVDLAKSNKKIYACVGLHPENVDDFNENTIEELERLAKEKKVVAIGEIGIDLHFVTDNLPLQIEVLLAQFKLANKLNMPVCIHMRDASAMLYEIFKDNIDILPKKTLLHCFSSTKEFAIKFSEMGCYFSFAGNFTYKNYDTDVVKVIPQNKILIETDSPYLTPVPFRGKEINNPLNVQYVAIKLAEVLGKGYEEICMLTTKNAKEFFNIK